MAEGPEELGLGGIGMAASSVDERTIKVSHMKNSSYAPRTCDLHNVEGELSRKQSRSGSSSGRHWFGRLRPGVEV